MANEELARLLACLSCAARAPGVATICPNGNRGVFVGGIKTCSGRKNQPTRRIEVCVEESLLFGLGFVSSEAPERCRRNKCSSWRGKAPVRPRCQGRGVGVHPSEAQSLDRRSGPIRRRVWPGRAVRSIGGKSAFTAKGRRPPRSWGRKLRRSQNGLPEPETQQCPQLPS